MRDAPWAQMQDQATLDLIAARQAMHLHEGIVGNRKRTVPGPPADGFVPGSVNFASRETAAARLAEPSRYMLMFKACTSIHQGAWRTPCLGTEEAVVE